GHGHEYQGFKAAGDEPRSVPRRDQGERIAAGQSPGRDGRAPAGRPGRRPPARLVLDLSRPQLFDRLLDALLARLSTFDTFDLSYEASLVAVVQPLKEAL